MGKSVMRRYNSEFLIAIILIVATFSIYWQVQYHDFVNVDDGLYITDNQNVREGFTKEGLIWAFSFNDVAYWHPVTWLSHMIDCQLYGLNPQGHHLNNLLFHVANVILLFLALRGMTSSIWRSAAVAAIFALHPLNVESVAWVAERKNVLSSFFWILTLWSYTHYSRKPELKRYLVVLLCLGLGLMAKPMLVTLPFVFLLLDYWPLARLRLWRSTEQNTRPEFRPASATRLVLEKIPFFTLSGMLTFLSFLSSHSRGVVASIETLPMGLRIQNALVSYVTYIFQMIWPNKLAMFYPYPETIPFMQYAGAGIFLAIVSILVLRYAKQAPYMVTGWLWYLGTLVPVIGLFQQGVWPATADRFVYVPLIGLLIMISWGFSSAWQRWRMPTIILSVTVCIVLSSLGIGTWLQVRHWKSSINLFSRAIKVTSNNHLAEYNLASALHEQGDLQEAVNHFSEAIRIMPHNAEFQNGLGVALLDLGDINKSIQHLEEALRLVPNYPDAHINLGAAYTKAERTEEAFSHYYRSLEIKPMAEAHHALGLAYSKKKEFDKAILHYRQALQIEPYADLHNDLGVTLVLMYKPQEAMSHFSEALRMNPNHVGARRNLALISNRLKMPTSVNKSAP